LTRQSELSSMLEGFMSLCSISAVCMYLRDDEVQLMQGRGGVGGEGGCRRT
jgi:hypothetical protein